MKYIRFIASVNGYRREVTVDPEILPGWVTDQAASDGFADLDALDEIELHVMNDFALYEQFYDAGTTDSDYDAPLENRRVEWIEDL